VGGGGQKKVGNQLYLKSDLKLSSEAGAWYLLIDSAPLSFFNGEGGAVEDGRMDKSGDD
jgi:hypothetical protein